MSSNQNQSTTPSTGDRLLRLQLVLEKTGFSRSSWYASMKRGEAPQPIKFGNASRWSEAEIDRWIAAQLERRGE